MSTKAIRELLDDVDGLLSDDDVTLEERIRAARVEVEAIEKAARTLSDDASVHAIQREDEDAVDAAADLLLAIAEGSAG